MCVKVSCLAAWSRERGVICFKSSLARYEGIKIQRNTSEWIVSDFACIGLQCF